VGNPVRRQQSSATVAKEVATRPFDTAVETGYPPYMEVDMELSKKTTILFPPKLHARLVRIAARRRTSLGALVRGACEQAYRTAPPSEGVAAVAKLRELRLPVGSPCRMKQESVPSVKDLSE